ncbi:hypothetical protein BDU57DRAFT_512619 [Ampelomyces quisqualis]|uniref:Uncharacterized protein n=1 Tax=Ampelomyces quisqualis TaxID=50730 RepID=A0A6A5R050_AMPQU|nr:hypothetical protein BDU57DRAFT_512619 [Ampelomyces quisqualis]
MRGFAVFVWGLAACSWLGEACNEGERRCSSKWWIVRCVNGKEEYETLCSARTTCSDGGGDARCKRR